MWPGFSRGNRMRKGGKKPEKHKRFTDMEEMLCAQETGNLHSSVGLLFSSDSDVRCICPDTLLSGAVDQRNRKLDPGGLDSGKELSVLRPEFSGMGKNDQ